MSNKSNDHNDDLTVQQKLSELTELVQWFQGSSFSLESALDKFKQAETLADDIEKDLTHLKNDITIVKKRFDAEG